MKDQSGEPLAFFTALWPAGLPEGGHLVLSVKRDNRMVPEFHGDTAGAAARAAAAGADYDVYVGMAAQPLLPKGRGTTDSALAIPGLWLDLDFDKGFGGVAGVDKFLSALPLRPSIQVLTGGGVHVYWLFREALEAGEDNEAVGLELGWLRYCREVAQAKLKAELDAVADLARIMRVPGTRNFKREPSVEVRLREMLPDRRYDPSSFSEWRSQTTSTRSAVSAATTLDFVLRDGAQPPFRKWSVAVANFPELDRIFMHQVKMPVDNSLSGYDLSLATRLDQLGWTPQEIVDSLIAHRAQWVHEVSDVNTAKDPLHLKDPGYYERLIRKARSSNERNRVSDQAAQLAEEVAEELSTAQESPALLPNLRQRWLLAVSQLVGVAIEDLSAVDTIESPWKLGLRCNGDLRHVHIGGPEKLLQWSTWKRVIMLSGAAVESIPKKEPPQLHALVCRSGMFVRVTGKGQRTLTTDSFVDYLLETADTAAVFEEASVLERQPFKKLDSGPLGLADWGQPEECLFVRPDAMHFDVRMGKCPAMANIGAALVELGFTYRTVFVRTDESRTSRSYYCLPISRLRALRRDSATDDAEAHGQAPGARPLGRVH